MRHCEDLRSKELKKLMRVFGAFSSTGKKISVAFGVFSFFRGPLEGVVGVLAVRSPVPGRGVVWESVEPGVEKNSKNRKFSIFFKRSKKSQNTF